VATQEKCNAPGSDSFFGETIFFPGKNVGRNMCLTRFLSLCNPRRWGPVALRNPVVAGVFDPGPPGPTSVRIAPASTRPA